MPITAVDASLVLEGPRGVFPSAPGEEDMCVDNPEAENQKAAHFRRLEHNSRYASALALSTNAQSQNPDRRAQGQRYNPPVETASNERQNPTYPLSRIVCGRVATSPCQYP
jgi:hypothetical protein